MFSIEKEMKIKMLNGTWICVILEYEEVQIINLKTKGKIHWDEIKQKDILSTWDIALITSRR